MQSLLQTEEWAKLRENYGWKTYRICGVSVLEKPLPLGLSFLYSPEVNFKTIKNLLDFLEEIKKQAAASRAIFYRLEILDEENEDITKTLGEKGFIKAFEEIQPEWRQVVDISKSEEEILAGMKQKGRYNIRIAQKHNIEVHEVLSDQLVPGVDVFYNLFTETAKTQGFSIRPKQYFQDLVETLYPKEEAKILIARYNGEPLAALILSFYDQVASYLYGASSNLNRNTMAPYLAHWEAIKLAKKIGCKTYDLLAVAPPDRENHKYSGITRFKEQFGGRKVRITGSWDLVYKSFGYNQFKMLEKLRRH